jgi:hypothetical protein
MLAASNKIVLRDGSPNTAKIVALNAAGTGAAMFDFLNMTPNAPASTPAAGFWLVRLLALLMQPLC